MFDLTRKITLQNIKEWYRKQERIISGYQFCGTSQRRKVVIVEQSRKFAKAMKAPLIFSSASHSINVQKLFKCCPKLFDLKANVEENHHIGEPLLELYPQPNASSFSSIASSSSSS
eukprot:jgi/Galph1/3221/GphlegSOOS_G1892.1